MKRRLILGAACALLSSCSFRLNHADGSTTYLGLVNLREGNAGTAPLVHSRRYGLMLDAGTVTTGVAVGYEDRLIVRPPDDATTTLDYSPGNGDPVMSIQPES
jgi:hypothetical protein